jgi:hypothetical protein
MAIFLAICQLVGMNFCKARNLQPSAALPGPPPPAGTASASLHLNLLLGRRRTKKDEYISCVGSSNAQIIVATLSPAAEDSSLNAEAFAEKLQSLKGAIETLLDDMVR